MLKNLCCEIQHDLEALKEYVESDTNYYLAPAFFDIQVNGYNKVSLDDGVTTEKLEQIAESVLEDGVSVFIPTLITSEPRVLIESLRATREFMKLYPGVVPGLHLEGPFICEEKKGIHNGNLIRKFSSDDLKTVLEYSDTIAYMTIDPSAFDEVFLQILLNQGIKLSLGHTNASYTDARRVIDQGLNLASHLYNAMAGMKDARQPMALEAILDSKSVYASIICDGLHVAYPLVNIAKKLLGEKLILTTDALSSAGVKNASQFISFKFAGKTIYNDLVHGCTDEHDVLAGSRITMLDAIRNYIKNCGATPEEAVYAAAIAPRKAFNITEQRDYIVLTEDMKLVKVLDI